METWEFPLRILVNPPEDIPVKRSVKNYLPVCKRKIEEIQNFKRGILPGR
jgi:hypothetical protein